MKKISKKIISVLLAATVLFSVFAIGVSAETAVSENDVYVAGTLVSGSEESYWLTVDGALTSDGAAADNYNVKYTPATDSAAAKITLKNANLSKFISFENAEYATYGGIQAECSLDVEITGSNSITVYPEELAAVYGIGSSNALNIYGDGSLQMDMGNEKTFNAVGISGDTINMSGSTAITVNANGYLQGAGAYSLYASTFSENASLDLNITCLVNEDFAYAVEEFSGYKITYEGIKLSDNAKVSVKANNPALVEYENRAFNIKGNVELSGNSHITAIAAGGSKSYGIVMNNGNITVSGTSSITAQSGNATVRSYGIYSYNGNGKSLSVTVSDSAKIIASSGDSCESGGIAAYANLTASDDAYISGISGEASEGNSEGVYFSAGAEINENAKVIGKAGSAVSYSYGINTNDLAVSNDAHIEAAGETVAICCDEYILNCTNPYVTVSTDTNSENATEWDGTSALGGEESAYKYVRIAPKAYTVEWVIDGVTTTDEYKAGEAIIKPATPEKEGYVFVGWDKEIPDVMPENDLTFVALFENDIYNLGEETYSFNNFIDSDSMGHCFGMSITSAGYYTEELNVAEVGLQSSNELYTLGRTEAVKAPICKYQAAQGRYSLYSTVAGGSYYKNRTYNIESDWNEVINYVKNHEYDDRGTLQIGFRKNNQGGHAINLLRYEEVDGQPRIYAYDNNFPNTETYFYMDENGEVWQAPYSTFSGSIDCIALRSVSQYFDIVDNFDSTRYIYADRDTISISGAIVYPIDGAAEMRERVAFEIPANVEQVTIIPLVDNAEFEYLNEEYSFGTINDNTVGVFKLCLNEDSSASDNADFTVVNGGSVSVTVAIRTPSTTTINYGDSIILHADASNIPEGGYIVWTASNGNFTYTVSDDGTTCTISPASSGDTTFTATIYDADEKAVSADEQVMTSKAGFFDKIIAFFKKLFGLTKTIAQTYQYKF